MIWIFFNIFYIFPKTIISFITELINLLKKYSKVSSPKSLYLPLSEIFKSSRFLRLYDLFNSLFTVVLKKILSLTRIQDQLIWIVYAYHHDTRLIRRGRRVCYAATQFQAVKSFLRTTVAKKKVGPRFYMF